MSATSDLADLDAASADAEELLGRLEALAEENERLRREYARARRSRYRRTAIGLAGLGCAALVGAALVPNVREVLLALGGTGLFAALLTYYLTPERFVPASVGETVYDALSRNLRAIVADLDLASVRLYVPVDGDPAVRLYVPESPTDEIPDADALRAPFVVEGRDRGLSLRPTGDALRAQFRDAATVPNATEPLVVAAAEALVEQFELVDGIEADVDVDDGRATVAISGSAYGSVDRFDHPVSSFLAATIADHRGVPVETDIDADADRADYLVTARWNPDA